MNALDLIAKRLAAPKNFEVITTYEDGAVRTHPTETIEQARTHASMLKDKVGRTLISHGDNLGHTAGDAVKVVSVEIRPIRQTQQ